MKIREFINKNYGFICGIARNEYNKEKNKILYKNYDADDFTSEVIIFFLKNYDNYDDSLSKERTFIITNCKYCAGALRERLKKDIRKIDLFTSNESELISKDEFNNDLNAYENIGKEDFYKEISVFTELTPKEKTLCLYKLHGLSMNEMEELTGFSRQTLWRHFKTIKEKIM